MNSYGLVFGGEKTSHDSGNDIAYQVVAGNNYSQVVIEGDEYILPKEAMQSEKVYDFVDKLPIEMLDEIKRSENVFIQFPNLRQGDMVVCKNSVRNDDLHTIKGTAKEIGNYLQGLSACRMYAKGGYISGELANGGGVEDESQLRLLTPMPPTKLGKTGIDSLTEIIGKDKMRPAFSGALYAGKGRIVATDANILVVLENQNYPKSLDGTIKSLWNKVPQERLVGIPYPNWEAVVPSQQNFQTKELSIDDVLAYAYGGFLEGKKIINEKDFNKYQKEVFKYILRLNIGNIEIGVDSLLLTRILRTLKANDVRKIVFHIGQTNQRPIKITTDNKHYGLIMPVMIADKVEDLGEAIYVSQQIFYPISEKDFRAMSKKYGEYLTEFSKMVGGERMAEGGEITMNMPLLIRVLELAKEDVKEDKEIHFIAERLQSIADKGTLTMEDYDYISGLESNDKIQKLIAENDSNDSDLRFEQGGEVEDLISRGIVDLKMYDTIPKHANEYGLQCLNPLFVQTICVSEPKRLKGLGTKVLSYIEKYAIENGHDLIFGHIIQEAKFTKDERQTFFCDIDMIKNWLHSNGYAIRDENNDFHKFIQSNKLEGGGSVLLAPNGKPSNLTPEQWHLVRTHEFKAWFGDWEALENAKLRDKGMDEVTLKNLASDVSKVVDENGEPLVVYHGGYIDFNVFDIDKTANKRFYFTPSKEYAEFRGQVSKAYFLKIIELYYVDWQQGRTLQKPKGKFSGYANLLNGIKNLNEIIVFEPTQIKLADGSNTTFDSNNPDIRFEQGGMLENGVGGEYDSLYAFLYWHKEYIPIFAKKYGINESEWEDFVSGELGYDKEILQNILGDGYKLFYDEEKDMFEVSEKRKRKKSGNYKIEKVSSKNEKQVLRIINEEIVTELKPRLAVFWNDMVVGGSTYEFKNGTYKFDLAILPEYQGLGISKGLIQSIIDDAKMLKAKSLEAEVVNKKLLSYLQSIGFSAYKSQGQDFAFLSLK
jgi:GNAT superfamily N-acetyltransferase